MLNDANRLIFCILLNNSAETAPGGIPATSTTVTLSEFAADPSLNE